MRITDPRQLDALPIAAVVYPVSREQWGTLRERRCTVPGMWRTGYFGRFVSSRDLLEVSAGCVVDTAVATCCDDLDRLLPGAVVTYSDGPGLVWVKLRGDLWAAVGTDYEITTRVLAGKLPLLVLHPGYPEGES